MSLWFLRHDKFPTTSVLFQRNCALSPVCEICWTCIEIAIHALRDCIYTWCSKVWQWLIRHSGFWDFFVHGTTKERLDFNLGGNGNHIDRDTWIVNFREAINRFCYRRNQHMHDKDFPPSSTFDLIRDILYRATNITIDVYNTNSSQMPCPYFDHFAYALGYYFF